MMPTRKVCEQEHMTPLHVFRKHLSAAHRKTAHTRQQVDVPGICRHLPARRGAYRRHSTAALDTNTHKAHLSLAIQEGQCRGGTLGSCTITIISSGCNMPQARSDGPCSVERKRKSTELRCANFHLRRLKSVPETYGS